MTVDILPLELNFARPFTVEVSRTLTIRNTGTSPLAFKVRFQCGALRHDVVTDGDDIDPGPRSKPPPPNSIAFDPMLAVSSPEMHSMLQRAVQLTPHKQSVLLQAMKQDPPLDAKCRDKFLVQCAPIPSDKDFSSIASVLESADKATLVERKIRVNWLAANSEDAHGPTAPAVSTPHKPSAVNGATETPDAPRTFSSPGGNANSTPLSAPPPYASDDPAEETDDKSERPKSAVSHAATSVSEAAQLSYEELKSKLAQAEAQLLNLKDGGLRQRNVKSASSEEKRPAGNTAQVVKQQQPDGVPVQIVALLCLLSFLLAYFFF
ncbi:integral ER membrane protein Scs2 [Metarhizium acridum CQMa 102]|uniref:Integral ER membrane protein Scs2 n=1 Tax=Metarhizium acridum (strain CQMa 102) TaxID=655827 RepID=E9E4Z5_METAQ|nr:integral ER membrane protein Scs2 [Metarhizium acridum CQMa 102]EFY89012.1 integral ER membrane protein Scs2 [Metarhizium acridum CQMa 102]